MGVYLSSSRFKQKGSGLAEFGLAAVLLLTIGLGTVEIAHWMAVRQVLSLALQEAARTGAVYHGNPSQIAESFENALLPLFTPAASAQQRLHQHLEAVQAQLGAPAWHMAVLSPHLAAFNEFDPPEPFAGASVGTSTTLSLLSAAHHLRRIDNDYQDLQHRRYLARGWPEGRGPGSAQTIYEANTLTLALIYPHRPLLPITRQLLRLLPGGSANYAARILSQGYLPLSRKVSQTMQSHPVRWPSLASGKITYGMTGPELADMGQACPGCHHDSGGQPNQGAGSNTSGGNTDIGPGSSDAPGAGQLPSTGIAPAPGGAEDAPVMEDLCGIALCCAD